MVLFGFVDKSFGDFWFYVAFSFAFLFAFVICLLLLSFPVWICFVCWFAGCCVCVTRFTWVSGHACFVSSEPCWFVVLMIACDFGVLGYSQLVL